MQYNLVGAHALPKTFQKLTKLLLVALFCGVMGGCGLFGEDVVDSGYYSRIVGFASDTTAIIFKQYWEQIEERCGFGTCDRTDYSDLELQLVDVRYNKVYWHSKAKYDNNVSVFQWSDSTILMLDGGGKYHLWNISEFKPQKINLIWNTKEEDIRKSEYRWHRWKNDSILIFSNFPETYEHLIIDTKTLMVNSWIPTSEYAEIDTCNYRWWLKYRKEPWWGMEVGSGCLISDTASCTISLISGKGDTLSIFSYTNNKCNFFDVMYVHYSFIEVSPVKNNYNSTTNAMFKYDEKGNIAKEPSFWINGSSFIDSLGNVTEY